MHKILLAIALSLSSPHLIAAEPTEEVVSFKCSLAIDAAFRAMDKQTDNKVTQEALSKIDDSNGEFVCIYAGEKKIFVRLQSTDMGPLDNKLLFTVDARTYAVVKTQFGR